MISATMIDVFGARARGRFQLVAPELGDVPLAQVIAWEYTEQCKRPGGRRTYSGCVVCRWLLKPAELDTAQSLKLLISGCPTPAYADLRLICGDMGRALVGRVQVLQRQLAMVNVLAELDRGVAVIATIDFDTQLVSTRISRRVKW